MNSNLTMIKKLRNAINAKGYKLLYSTYEFFSDEKKGPVTIYCIKEAVYNEQKGRNDNIELFKSGSQIQIVLFLRDFWYKINGIPLPTDNEKWNSIRKKIAEKQDSGEV